MKTQKLTTILSVMVLVIIAWACQNNSNTADSNLYTNDHKATVKEVIQASSYTYLNVEEGGENFWIAVNKGEFEIDAVLYFDKGLEMTNFESKDLGRTFESVYFVQGISDQPTLPGATSEQPSMAQTEPQKPTLEKKNINIEPAEGGISIATLYSNRDTYKDQIVSIKGEVTKFNPSIMNRNWVHIQDGTDADGNFDLTITTDQVVNVGDVVTFKGKISLNKDFGAGYTYEVIMEEATKADAI